MKRGQTPGGDMTLSPLLTALLLAGWTVYCLLYFDSRETSRYHLQANPEVLLLICPMVVYGIIASLATYQLWWSDRALSYRLLVLIHVLVLAGGAILAWLLASVLAAGQGI